LTVQDDSIVGFTVSPASLMGGASSTGTLTLRAAAPTGGWTVNLNSEFPSLVQVPSSVTIPAGSKTGTFTISTSAYSESFGDLITATDPTSSKSVRLSVTDDSIVSISFNPGSVEGGASSTGTIDLAGPAPAGGWTVSLKSENATYVQVPASITIPAGSRTGTFQITTVAYTTTFTNLITATDATSTKAARITVTP
jgi:hypothetical protein